MSQARGLPSSVSLAVREIRVICRRKGQKWIRFYDKDHMVPIQGSVAVQGKLENIPGIKAASQSWPRKDLIKMLSGLKMAWNQFLKEVWPLKRQRNAFAVSEFLDSPWPFFGGNFSPSVKLNIRLWAVLNAELWVQSKALLCVSCTKNSKFMHPTGDSGCSGKNDSALLPSHPSLLLHLLQVLQCKVCFLRWASVLPGALYPRAFPIPEDRKVRWVDGNICSFLLFLPFHIPVSVIRLWKPHHVLLIISC